MNEKKMNGNTITHVPFDLKDMSDDEMRSMFMGVSVKSLAMWLDYYQGKEQYEVCRLIKEIRDHKNGNGDTASGNY